jgi:hypothetical protein
VEFPSRTVPNRWVRNVLPLSPSVRGLAMDRGKKVRLIGTVGGLRPAGNRMDGGGGAWMPVFTTDFRFPPDLAGDGRSSH